MATIFELAPGLQVAGVGDGGDLLGPYEFDNRGRCEVPADFQEAHRLLLSVGAKPLKPKENS